MSQNVRSLAPGDRISHFVINRVLGDGSFGITYLATDPTLRRKVAIKEYFPQKYAMRENRGTIVPINERAEATFAWALDRFSEEAKTLAKFSHRNIVRVIDFIPNVNKTAYIVMEYIEGKTIDCWVEEFQERGELPNKTDTISVFRQLLDGCGAMHRIGILHRDIKPRNIMLCAEYSEAFESPERKLFPVLIDFGSSRDLALQQDGFSALVTDGFSPPEQYSRNSTQGEPADIYALACTFFYILTGREPPNASARLVEPLPAIDPGRAALFGESFLRAVKAGMELQVGDRPNSISEWRSLLKIDEVGAQDAGASEGKISRRKLIIGGIAASSIVAGGVGLMMPKGSRLSSFARPLRNAVQFPLPGTIYPDSFPQVQVLPGGGAVIAANRVMDSAFPSMRATQIGADALVKLDWVDSTPNGMATAILSAEDGGAFLGGKVNGSAVLVRLGPDWREQWRREIGKGGVTAILPSKDGLVMGVEGPEFSGAEIVAVDRNGGPLWRTAIDKGKSETIQRMIALENGGHAVLGWGVESRATPQGILNQNYTFVALLDAEGNSLNRPQTKGLGAANGYGIIEADGFIYATGWTSEGICIKGGENCSPTRMFVWAIDAKGATQWVRWDYPSALSGARALAKGDGGLLYVGGSVGQPQRMRLSQIGPDGDMLWDQTQPAVGRISALFDLALRSDGSGFAIGGAQTGDAFFQLVVTKLDG